MPTTGEILAQMIKDIEAGLYYKPPHYLEMFDDITDEASRNRAMSKIYNARYYNKQELNAARDRSKHGYKSGFVAKPKEEITIDEYAARMVEGSRMENSVYPLNYHKKCSFSKAIALAFYGDVHFGAAGCDCRSALDEFIYCRDNDVKIVNTGDWAENKKLFPRAPRAVTSQTLSPDMQEDLLIKLFTDLRKNMLACVSGNHESANERHGEKNMLFRACRAAEVDFFAGACLLEIEINGASYRVFSRHTPLSKSKVSPLLGIRKMAQLEHADIYSGAHLHTPTYSIDFTIDGMRICILTGTFNDRARYSLVGYGEYSARQEFPAVVLMPEEKKMIPFPNVYDAVLYRDIINLTARGK